MANTPGGGAHADARLTCLWRDSARNSRLTSRSVFFQTDSVSRENSLQKIAKLKACNAFWDIAQKVVQICALIVAGIWVIFSFFTYQAKSARLDELIKQAQLNVQKQEFQYASQHRPSTDLHVSVEPIRNQDSGQNYYLVVLDLEITNDTERPINFTYAVFDFYLGKDASADAVGYIQEPDSKLRQHTVNWTRFSAYYNAREGFEQDAQDMLGPIESNWVTQISKYPFIPSKQHSHIVTRFIVGASQSDWIGIYYHCAFDKGTSFEDLQDDFVLKNISIELNKAKEPQKP
jgi:hypothetical protein